MYVPTHVFNLTSSWYCLQRLNCQRDNRLSTNGGSSEPKVLRFTPDGFPTEIDKVVWISQTSSSPPLSNLIFHLQNISISMNSVYSFVYTQDHIWRLISGQKLILRELCTGRITNFTNSPFTLWNHRSESMGPDTSMDHQEAPYWKSSTALLPSLIVCRVT